MRGLLRSTQRRIARWIPLGMRKRLAAVLPDQMLRSYRRLRTDVYLVSFPKCGRTWMRVMLGRAFQLHFALPSDADLVELHRLAEFDTRVPCVVATHEDAQWKTPEAVSVDTARYGATPVILLVRDPRDVIVSLYYQRRGRHGGYDGTLADFLEERTGGFETLLRFYDAWADALDDLDAVTVVRYEDLHAQPEVQLRRVLDFVGLDDIGPEAVADAIAFASFDHMRELEEAGTFASEKLRPGRIDDVDTYKTRRGVVGGYRDELNPAQIARLDALLTASRASTFGYEA